MPIIDSDKQRSPTDCTSWQFTDCGFGRALSRSPECNSGGRLFSWDKIMVSTYQQQAQTFLDSNGLTLRITLYPADMQRAPMWAFNESGDRVERHGLRYRVTIKKSGTQLSFDFWDSIANREILERYQRLQGKTFADNRKADSAKPDAYSVLSCISSDQFCADSFAEFCSDYEYDSDSRKALRTFKRLRSFAKRVRRFFSEAELAQLSEIQ